MADLMTVTTDTNGEYRFDGVPYGSYEVMIKDRNGREERAISCSITKDGINEASDLNLIPHAILLSKFRDGRAPVKLYDSDPIYNSDLRGLFLGTSSMYDNMGSGFDVGDDSYSRYMILSIEFGPGWTRSNIPNNFCNGFYISSISPLPDCITTIGDNFLYGVGLTSQLVIPESVLYIGAGFLGGDSSFDMNNLINKTPFPITKGGGPWSR